MEFSIITISLLVENIPFKYFYRFSCNEQTFHLTQRHFTMKNASCCCLYILKKILGQLILLWVLLTTLSYFGTNKLLHSLQQHKTHFQCLYSIFSEVSLLIHENSASQDHLCIVYLLLRIYF